MIEPSFDFNRLPVSEGESPISLVNSDFEIFNDFVKSIIGGWKPPLRVNNDFEVFNDGVSCRFPP